MRLLEILFYSYVGERTWKVENSSKRAWVRKLYQRSDYQTASGRVWGKDNEIRFKGMSSTSSSEISLSPTFFYFKNPRPGRSHCRLDTWGFNFHFTSKLHNWSVFPNVRSVLQGHFVCFRGWEISRSSDLEGITICALCLNDVCLDSAHCGWTT